jgi:hypothetical protein
MLRSTPIRADITVDTSTKREMQAMVSVLSRRSAFGTRQTIRETWASGHNNVFFVVGTCCPIPPKHRKKFTCTRTTPSSITEQSHWDKSCANEDLKIADEEEKYKDMIRVSDYDVYYNLPKKVMSMYEWTIQHTEAKWIAKTDDDCYVRIGETKRWLNTLTPTMTRIGISAIPRYLKVFRSGQYAENKYPKDTYPPFLLGGSGYIISSDIAKIFVDNQQHLEFYMGEDTSQAIWIETLKLNTKLLHDPLRFTPHAEYGKCDHPTRLFSGHTITPKQIKTCYESDRRRYDLQTKKDVTVAGMVTIKGREKNVVRVIDSLKNHVEHLFILCATGCEEITKLPVLKESWISVLLEDDPHHDCEKFLAIERYNFTGYFFTVDDDIIYPEDYVNTMKKAIDGYCHKAVVSVHGGKLPSQVTNFAGQRGGYHFNGAVGQDSYVNIVGTGVTAFHTSTVPMLTECMPRHSDLAFAKYCQKNKVPMIVLKQKGGRFGSLPNPFTLWGSYSNSERLKTTSYASDITWEIHKLEGQETPSINAPCNVKHIESKDEIISVLKAKKPELKTKKPELKTRKPVLKAKKPELKTKKPELKTRQPVLKAKKPELKAKKPDENNNCHKQINIEEYCKKHTCGDQLEDLEIETKNIQTKTKQTSILLNLNTFYKLQEKEKVFSWTSTTVGMVNYFNIIQHKTTAYLYYRCDCIQFNPKEQGGCVCLRTSQDNGLTFSKEIRIPKISNCLAFYVFIDTKPGTKPEEIFKAVYGVNERHGDGQWMAAASSDGLVWKDLGPIWNRAKLIRSSSLIYAFDALNTVYYDNDIGRYVAYARSVKQWSSRGVMHASTSDFMNWPNKNWQEVEFDPPLKSGESLYLMNGLKCPLPNCPYNMGFSSLYNSHENNDCNAKGIMPHHADCEEGYQDTFFTIGSGNTFKRPSNFNVFDRKSEQYFPRNTWPAAGSIVNEEEETVSYYIAHDVNLPNSYLQRYTMPFYRWASQSCQEEECTISYDLGLASDIEDIKLNIKTYSMHSKVTYSLIFGDQQSFSCNHANAAAFMGNEKAYSIRFGYQKWEHVKRKYASTHATGGIPMVYDWYNKNPREKWPLKMPKKGMNYKNCYFNSLQCLSKTDPTFAGKVVCKLEIKMKHADLYAIDVEKKSIDPNAAKDTGI